MQTHKHTTHTHICISHHRGHENYLDKCLQTVQWRLLPGGWVIALWFDLFLAGIQTNSGEAGKKVQPFFVASRN